MKKLMLMLYVSECSSGSFGCQFSVRIVEHSIGHSQFAPSPLIKEFTILLNLHSDVKNLLNGFLEAVEVVVNQSCEGQRESRGK